MTTAPAPTPSFVMLERMAAALFGLVALMAIAGATGWDRLFDTGFLVAAIARVARPGAGRGALPWLSVYLWLDAAVQLGIALCAPSAMIVLAMAQAGLYGVALALRMRGRGVSFEALPWRGGPAITLAALGAVALLHLPMATVHRADPMWTGPLVVTVGQATTMSAGRTIDLGTDVVLRGLQVPLGRGVALSLAAIAIAWVARTAGLVGAGRALAGMRAAAVAVAAWWLLVARGFHSPTGLLFAGAVGWLLYALFARAAGKIA